MMERARPLSSFGEVLRPENSDEPILEPNVRSAVFGWLREIQAADDLKAVNVKPRSTCILFGPPGCGKTTLAHHLSARLGVSMLVVRADMLLSKYLGDFTKNIGGLFDAIDAQRSPVMVFLDEIDSIGRSRDTMTGSGGADSERHSALNVLLQRIEQFENGWLIAATNKENGLDDALWRRFKMQIDVALPGHEERSAILRRYFEPYQIPAEVIIDLAHATEGASPALLRELAEGVKRSLVLFPKMGLDADQDSVFASVIKSVRPHPSYDVPDLWQRGLNRIDFEFWPPELGVGS